MSDKPKILINKPGHIVVLDQNWHKLFKDNKTFKMNQLEKKLNKLLKEQGKVNTEYEGYKKLKKQIMDDIMSTMGDEGNAADDKKQKNSRYIKEINRKFDRYEELKSELPSQIEDVNRELLTESMIQCYKELMTTKESSEQLQETIRTMKDSLKEKVGQREDLEQSINQLYTYMHDIAGFEVIEALDKHYFGGDK